MNKFLKISVIALIIQIIIIITIVILVMLSIEIPFILIFSNVLCAVAIFISSIYYKLNNKKRQSIDNKYKIVVMIISILYLALFIFLLKLPCML